MLEMPHGSVRNIIKFFKKNVHSVVSPSTGRKKK
ncbi:hypothetical protein PC111_g16921 [Phytophthora cactorum]|nr:hypothetical protein PC111_g16921 [Phytophthora cactorum]